ESNTEDPALEVQEEENTEATEESQPAEEEPVPSEEGGSSEPEPTPESPTEIPEPEPTPEPVIETPASEPATEAPAAFLFAKVAHAQEAETPAEPAPVEEVPVEEVILEEEPPAEEPVTEVVEEEPAEEEVVEEPVEEAIEESVSTPAEPEGSELTISYTTDGEIWTEVTTFTPRGNEVTFDLAVPTTAEFERLVIRLTADSIVKDIELWDLEVRIWTETPLDQLLEPLPVEDVVGSHVFNREFTIDPDASHYCVFEPLTVDLSSGTTTTFTLSLKKGDDLGQGISGFVADVSEAILEAITDEPLPEPVVEEPVIEPAATTTEEIVVEEPITEEVVEETASTTEEEIASTTEETSVEEVASTTEEEERGIIEEIVESGIETLEQLARLRVGLLEIGSLPVGIDIRFIGDTPYLVELFDDSPETFTLSANVFALEGAQEGSFSVPLVFTRTDGKESTVVCQINVLNRPGSVPMYVPAEPAPEPELESVEEPAP
nr:hypothetical protein [Candidatus Paceibacterota bacterium]